MSTAASAPDEPPRPRVGLATIVFVVVALVMGVAFALVTPALWGHDEVTHVGRTQQVADGGFLPQPIDFPQGPAWGGEVPSTVVALVNLAMGDYNDNSPDQMGQLVDDPARYRQLESQPTSGPRETLWFSNTSSYSPVPYLLMAATVKVSELAGADVGTMLTAARLASLLGYLLVAGFAVRVLRGRRIAWLLVAVGLIPEMVFEAGSITADSMTNALALLATALVVKAAFLRSPLSRGEQVAAAATVLALPLCKPTYVLLAGLVLLLPRAQLGRRLGSWPGRLGLGAVALAACLAWNRVAAVTQTGSYAMRPPELKPLMDPAAQVSGLEHSPLRLVKLLWRTFVHWDQTYLVQFFGQLGFSKVALPAVAIVASALAMAVATFASDRLVGRVLPMLSLLAIALTWVLVAVALYVGFTPVGSVEIDGIQGRYFLPVAALTLVLLARVFPGRLHTESGVALRERTLAMWVGGLAALALVATIVPFWWRLS